MKKTLLAGLATCFMTVGIVGVVSAATVNWVDWQTASTNPDTVTGLIAGVTVTYTGDYDFVQLGTGTNYWTESISNKPYTGSATIDNAPTASEMIALNN